MADPGTPSRAPAVRQPGRPACLRIVSVQLRVWGGPLLHGRANLQVEQVGHGGGGPGCADRLVHGCSPGHPCTAQGGRARPP
eukprot:239832-Alexandrium_andersonii.AAC.1